MGLGLTLVLDTTNVIEGLVHLHYYWIHTVAQLSSEEARVPAQVQPTSPLAGALGEESQPGTPEALRAAENQALHRTHKIKKKRASPL